MLGEPVHLYLPVKQAAFSASRYFCTCPSSRQPARQAGTSVPARQAGSLLGEPVQMDLPVKQAACSASRYRRTCPAPIGPPKPNRVWAGRVQAAICGKNRKMARPERPAAVNGLGWAAHGRPSGPSPNRGPAGGWAAGGGRP
ncbi:hypothetical protein PCANC_17103 [Puccinia coronata f. sp. avenae]|uniref:Uncharacterized protein n=1 Tax=Puccinia coronata f. sp. avenae TaxID=200324 RepID=A0A2N5U5E7_9BASI|nr:hypothetical protein PCANC_17103 [Puccinia coronata f. sp. avenae]